MNFSQIQLIPTIQCRKYNLVAEIQLWDISTRVNFAKLFIMCQIQSCGITTTILIFQYDWILTRFRISLIMPHKWFAFCFAECCILNYILSFWQYGQLQGCGCTTTIQLMGIGIALGENLTVPLKSSTVANSLLVVLICTCWQYYQIQGSLVLTTIV